MFLNQPRGRLRTIARSPWTRRVLVSAIVAVAAMLLLGIPGLQSLLPYRIDLDVYRLGADVLLSGGDLYGPLGATRVGISLPFTYPPIAAAFFVVLAVVPYWAANLLLTASTLVAIVLVQLLVVRDARLGGRTVALVAVLGALLLGPVIETVGFGQVNALLMALVVTDLIAGRGRPWRGLLIGLAIAVKLTPAVFLAYFLVRRDWRGLGMAAGSALAWTGLGFVIAPAASVQYWTQTILDPSRIGGLAYVSNQSINGALVRLTGTGGVAWFLLCAVLGIACLFAMRRLVVAGESTSAMVIMGCYSLLASPVSWSHHWVWVAPALVVLVDRWRRTGAARFLLVAVSGIVVFVSRVVWAMPHEGNAERTWHWWQHIVGNAQVLWGLAAIATLATMGARSRRRTPQRVGSSVPTAG